MPSQLDLGVPRKEKSKGHGENGESFDFIQFLKEARNEFNKISWPTTDQVTKEFFAVLILVSILTGIIYSLDKIFGYLSNFFMGQL